MSIQPLLDQIKANLSGIDKLSIEYCDAVFNHERPNKQEFLIQCKEPLRSELNKTLCDIDRMYKNKLAGLPLLTTIEK